VGNEKPTTLALRTGECLVAGCIAMCQGYAYAGHQDGFDTCSCSHTRWAHAKQEGTINA
jgi:hypothetical protein